MKILVICRPLTFHGGIEQATAGFHRALVEHGDAVSLLTPGPDPRLPGVAYRRLRVPPSPPPLRPLVLAVHPAVADFLTGDGAQHVSALITRFGRSVRVEPRPDVARNEISIERD